MQVVRLMVAKARRVVDRVAAGVVLAMATLSRRAQQQPVLHLVSPVVQCDEAAGTFQMPASMQPMMAVRDSDTSYALQDETNGNGHGTVASQNWSATIIQANWRGYMHRHVIPALVREVRAGLMLDHSTAYRGAAQSMQTRCGLRPRQQHRHIRSMLPLIATSSQSVPISLLQHSKERRRRQRAVRVVQAAWRAYVLRTYCKCPFALPGHICLGAVHGGDITCNLCCEIVYDGDKCNCPCDACRGHSDQLPLELQLAARDSAMRLIELRNETLEREAAIMGEPTTDAEADAVRNQRMHDQLRLEWAMSVSHCDEHARIMQAYYRRWRATRKYQALRLTTLWTQRQWRCVARAAGDATTGLRGSLPGSVVGQRIEEQCPLACHEQGGAGASSLRALDFGKDDSVIGANPNDCMHPKPLPVRYGPEASNEQVSLVAAHASLVHMPIPPSPPPSPGEPSEPSPNDLIAQRHMVQVEVQNGTARGIATFDYATDTVANVFNVLVVGQGLGSASEHLLMIHGVYVSVGCLETIMHIDNASTPPGGVVRMTLHHLPPPDDETLVQYRDASGARRRERQLRHTLERENERTYAHGLAAMTGLAITDTLPTTDETAETLIDVERQESNDDDDEVVLVHVYVPATQHAATPLVQHFHYRICCIGDVFDYMIERIGFGDHQFHVLTIPGVQFLDPTLRLAEVFGWMGANASIVDNERQMHFTLQHRISQHSHAVVPFASFMAHSTKLLAALPSSRIPEHAELSDNGASTGIAKTKLGLIPGTERQSDGGGFALGDDRVKETTVTNAHIYYRCGLDGTRVAVYRRKHFVPDGLCTIGSEGEDVNQYNMVYTHNKTDGRVVCDSTGNVVKLHMSPNGLGWYWMEECNDAEVIRMLLKGEQVTPVVQVPPSVSTLSTDTEDWVEQPKMFDAGTGVSLSTPTLAANVHTGVSMGRPPKLSGYDILVRMHVVLAHSGLDTVLRTLDKMGLRHLVTDKDVESMRARKCGICDTALMIAPPFKRSVVQPKPAPGMYWTRDTIMLKRPSCEHKWWYITGYTDHATSKWLAMGHVDYTADTVIKLDQRLRAFNRPHRGEVMRIKSDNHPSYKSTRTVDNFDDAHMLAHYSMAYAHQMVGDAEVMWRVGVPRSNALLLGCPSDGGHEHFPTAFFTVVASHNSALTAQSDVSPDMQYYGRDTVVLESQIAYGAPVKWLQFAEARDSKFDDHAAPGTFRGPSRETLDDSPVLCWVLTTNGAGRKVHTSVRMGCLRVDERPVIARTLQSHPSHQPCGDITVERSEDIPPAEPDFSAWRDVTTEGYVATSQTAAVRDGTLASVARIVWQPSMLPPQQLFFVGLCGGEIGYDYDMPDIIHRMSKGTVTYVVVDIAVGGHGHNIVLDRVKDALKTFVAHDRCRGIGISPDCSPTSALLCLPDGPRMLFNLEHVDGIPNLSVRDTRKQADALAMYQACADILTSLHASAATTSKCSWWEGPVGRGSDSAFAIPGQEQHSSMFHITCVRDALRKCSSRPVYFDQQPLGATSLKTTVVYGSPDILPHLDELLGSTPLAVPDGSKSTVGFNEQQQSKASALKQYPLGMRVRLATAMLRTLHAAESGQVGGVDDDVDVSVLHSMHTTDATLPNTPSEAENCSPIAHSEFMQAIEAAADVMEEDPTNYSESDAATMLANAATRGVHGLSFGSS